MKTAARKQAQGRNQGLRATRTLLFVEPSGRAGFHVAPKTGGMKP